MEWKPIETAPKDGTEFLATKRGWLYPHSVYWSESRQSFENPFCDYYMDQPSHWMPFPEPPTKEVLDD